MHTYSYSLGKDPVDIPIGKEGEKMWFALYLFHLLSHPMVAFIS